MKIQISKWIWQIILVPKKYMYILFEFSFTENDFNRECEDLLLLLKASLMVCTIE